MQNIRMITGIRFTQIRTNKFLIPGIALIILIAAGLTLMIGARKPSPDLPVLNSITESALEEQYGLRVNLIAVTGAGGFVDLRIKIVDGEKAKLLLTDKDNFPSIMAENDMVLNAPEDTKSQPIIFENNMDMFILFPNLSNAVEPESQVRVLFGDTALEPIDVVH